jgi:TRAP-type C4-dicarboxylate transport system permease small subunit
MTQKVPPVALGRAGRILEAIGGAMILAMMTVTALDVAGRYFLNRPIGGAFEITEVLMGLVIFAGMPLATARREHIAIDLFDTALSWRFRCWQAAIGDLICAGISAALAWRIWTRGQSLIAVGETTMQLGLPRGAVALAMSVLMGAAALVFVVASLVALRAAIQGRAP